MHSLVNARPLEIVYKPHKCNWSKTIAYALERPLDHVVVIINIIKKHM